MKILVTGVFCILLLMNFGCSSSSSDGQQTKGEKTSMDYMVEGNIAYKAQDYQKAIGPYRKAFDMEKENQKLEKKWWYVLLDNLAISYGITGDVKNAQEIAEYGISKDASYPMFYYILADCYGEKDDEENAIKNLRLAYQYKNNLVEGENFPDPAGDDSFKNLVKKESFMKAVNDMKNGK